MADSKAARDPGHPACRIPELRSRRPPKNRVERDPPACDQHEHRVVRTSRPVRLLLIADEPRPHGILRRLTRERIERPIALRTPGLIGRLPPAKRADKERRQHWRIVGHGGNSMRSQSRNGSTRLPQTPTHPTPSHSPHPPLPAPAATLSNQRATSIALVSRRTVTLISPGKVISSLTFFAILCAIRYASSSLIRAASTITRTSRPA